MQLIVTVHQMAGKFTTVQCKFIMGLGIPRYTGAMLIHACGKCDACPDAAGSPDKKLLATECEHASDILQLV